MKLVCISDTHNLHHDLKIPDGDVLVHAGDITVHGKFENFAKFNDWLGRLPHKHKVVIPGNHDIEAGNENAPIVEAVMVNCHWLVNKEVTIDGVKFYGVPQTPSFFPESWVFNVDRKSIREAIYWDAVPRDTDVVISHGPPRGYGDLCPEYGSPSRMVNVGCDYQLEVLEEIRPLLNICGHIHEGYGTYITNFGTVVANASTCTRGYKPKNPPLVFNL